MSNLVKIFEKVTPKGLVEIFFAPYEGEPQVEVWRDGEEFDEGEPSRIDERSRKARKIPKEAALVIGTSLFSEPGATEILETFERMKAEYLAALLAAAATLEPIGYLYEVGCDTSDTYRVLFPEGIDYDVCEAAEERLGTDAIAKHLHSADFRAIAEATGAEAVEANLGIYWGYRFDRAGFDRLLALATGRRDDKEAARRAKHAAADAARAAKIAEARATGKPVLITSWTEDCDRSVAECSTDVIYRTAQPDGTITTKRVHTQ